MKPKKDIYNHDINLKRLIQRIEKSEISQRNKDLIRDFDRMCFIESLSKPRRLKLLTCLFMLARKYITKDFDMATKENLKDVVMSIDGRDDYSPWTKQGYKVVLKKFYKWLHYGDEYLQKMEYPAKISWLKASINKKKQPKVKASDILTEAEIKALISTAEHPRDKAFISMLYELGARIGEMGGLLIKEVTRDKYGYIADLEGKTGHRTPRIVISAAHVTHWLNVHPLKDKPDAPFWVMIGSRDKHKRMEYPAFRALVKRLVAKAGIKKRVYHHLFRHTRVTHLLINKQINEAQAKVYFGWVPNSTMLSEYSHLMSSDVNNAILAINGIVVEKKEESLLKPKVCPQCQTVNSTDSKFCHNCASILDVRTALDLDESRKKADSLITELFSDPHMKREVAKRIVELGLKDKLTMETK
jgi:site-specific recombinase XerD